ncbi:ferritin-like domain-containing protein [Antrihabitans cavernicola]|uniref:Ferritin-like domain-containing protein n=1 Tax=Antrihabitans cavernicola TaxID=2495913 RepID=A0A5A7S4T5_9NOCA|nr:ferritin-like domain-containing protein [Spelaeibacter cavernicola]KAA0017686.1 ferritin-like domain-containing protein [Spelaeibacter cavernicola]
MKNPAKAPMETMLRGLPMQAQNEIHKAMDNIGLALSIENPKVAAALAPSAVRGLVLGAGKRGDHVDMQANHSAHYTLSYQGDFTEMYDLYRRAVTNQWDGDADLPWNTDVAPDNHQAAILPRSFVPFDAIEGFGVRLTALEERRLTWDVAAWILSQFMHGEQGALYAAAQVTESVQWMDGKLYGATQVMDEGRHLEVFLRYLDTKLEKIYTVNDNLFVIIDDLMTDGRWDIKFLGMQIMIEGLALGAFTTIYQQTREPLLKQLLKMVIQDEARHVHYGVLALREHFTKNLSESERREREDWAYEVALLMRNRFKMREIYDEWFSHKISLKRWDEEVLQAPGMLGFRNIMFQRLVPNLEYIGLMSDRIKAHYDKSGLTQYLGGKNATQLTADELTAEPDTGGHDDEMPAELHSLITS